MHHFLHGNVDAAESAAATTGTATNVTVFGEKEDKMVEAEILAANQPLQQAEAMLNSFKRRKTLNEQIFELCKNNMATDGLTPAAMYGVTEEGVANVEMWAADRA